jgi:hypothetical protein
MGSSESGPHDIRSSEGGSVCLCRLRLCRLCALQQALSCILMHTGISPPRNLIAQWSPSWTIPYLASRMIEGIVFGQPMDSPVRVSCERQH